jgi:heat shock protein HtpX
MWWLRIRMFFLVVVMFAVINAVIWMIAYSRGITSFYFYAIVSVFLVLVQYMIGPKLVEWTMRVRPLKEDEYPGLHRMVAELAERAGIPKPRLCMAMLPIPNAFAYGRSLKDGRVCVTEGIVKSLNERELRAVLGHEIAHLKSRDVLFITLLSVVPMILYLIARHFMFAGAYGRDRDRQSGTVLVGLAALVFYFVTNLLVLYASRIREYFADRSSIVMGNEPSSLASALYKLVYGSARTDKESLKEVEGLKAFFVNDPSVARNELWDLRQLDVDKSGTIDTAELENLRTKGIRVGFADKMLEIFGTHPNMLKRIKRLSTYRKLTPQPNQPFRSGWDMT